MIKSFTKYILTLVAILIATSNAWAISNAEVTVISEPSVGGTVAINSSNSATDWGTNKSKKQEGGFFEVNKNFTFYRFASAASGYTFKGWSTSQTANSGETNSQFTAQGGRAGTKSYTYYAIFATLQSSAHNTTVSFDNTKVDEQSSKSITIKHSHAGTVSLSLSGTNAGDFSLSENSFTSTSYQEGRNITIYFKPTCVGERTATLTISSNNGLNSLTIYLKGNGLRHTPTAITWQEPIDVNMFIGDSRTVNVNSTTDGNITYSSSNTSVLSVSGNTLTAKAEGIAIITAIQAATCKYEADTITKTFTINNKKTPTFWLNGDPDQLTDNLKTEDTRTITITNVDERMTADYDPNLLSYTFNGSTATIKALDAGPATLKLTQPENNQIFYGERTFTFNITKYDTNTITNDLATNYMVDDVIVEANIYTINNDEVPVEIISGNNNILKFENGQLKAVGAGTTTLTVKQSATNKWVERTATKTITVHKYDITASINPDNAVWNQLVTPNPFSASTQHKFSGATSAVTDFTVTQQGNEHIALMDTNTRNIQTYFNDGTVKFLVSRQEDYKYNELLEELELIVEHDKNGCYAFNDNTKAFNLTKNSKTSQTIQLDGVGNILTFYYKINSGIDWVQNDHHVTTQYSDDGTNFSDISNSKVSTNTKTDKKSHEIQVPQTAKYIRFVWSANGTGSRDIYVSNITVTRAQYLRPTDAEGALGVESENVLELPTVAINQRCSTSFKLSWSACSDIKIVCDNPKFTIGTTDISSANGEQEISVDCNTSEVGTFLGNITIYNQEQMETFPISCEVYTKWLTDSISGSAAYSMKVDTTWDTDFYFPIQRASEYPTTDGSFHYAIEHTFVDADQADRNPNHPDKVISYNNGVITAHNAGTAILTIKHDETAEHFASQQFTCTLTVSKRTPVFTWNDPVYFNQTTVSDYFITNNTDTDIKIDSQSDTDVAVLYFNPNDDSDKHTLDLTTYYKETTPASSTTVTVSQAENWYWYAKEDTHTITPQNRNNHLSNTPITNANLDDFKLEYVDPWNKPWTSDGIHFGQGGIGSGDGGYNWNDKYIIIEFTGVPDSLYFTTETTGSATMDNPLTGDDNATNNKFFYVSAGTSKDNLEEIWSSTSKENNYKDKLDPSVRFLKLCYTGNLEGWFKNVRITELNEFEAKVEGQDETTIDTLDFGVVHITDKTEKTMVFNFKYANAGYKVSLDLDQTGGWAEEEAYQEAKKYIKITPSLIDTIGGEKYGEVKNIQVTFHSDDQSTYTIPEDARLKIADEAGHITYVYLKGEIVCTEDQIDWNAYFSLQEPIQIPISTDSIYNAANTDKYSKLPLKYRSASNGSIIKVSPNGKCFIPAGIGQDTIYAYHDGNNKVCPVESMKIVEVTEKSIQLIDWRDDLSDIIFGSDDNITLTAKVYIIDVVNNTFEYSPEQTANLVYTVADEGESVVSIEEGTTTLKVNGLGETHLTVTIAPNDSLEGATMTIPVVVREPAIGCEDELLLDQTAPVEIFTEGINTNQVVKPAIPIDRSKGVPGYLKFEHKGEYWKLTGLINYYAGNIKAQQSTDGGTTWTDVPGSEIKPTVGTYNPTSLLPIDRNATHIRFVRPNGGQGYHYYRNVQVYPAQYIETSTNSLNFEKINMGGTYSKTITISYSNIKSPIINSTSSKDITITPAHFGECSGFGTQEVTITWNPNTKENQYIIFEDTLIDLSVRVDLIAEIDGRKQAIVWNNRTEAIYEYTDIDNRPTHTIDYNNQQPLDHPITYEVTAGNAAFENGIFFIKGTGEITIHAYHDGNDAYQRVDSFYQFNVPEMPPTFLGTAGDSLWTTQDNWANNYVPEETQTAVILAPLVIRDHKIINQLLVSDEGSVHITSTGGLTVGEGGIQCSKTDGSAIVIDNLHTGAGFLRVDPTYEGTMPRITMRYQTRSTLDNGANKDAEWQYIGAPGLNSTIYVDYNTWLYKLDEPNNNWVLQPRVDSVSLDPFEGYAITQYGQPTYEWTADMTTANCTIPLTYSKNGRGGRHIIANSYTAPINVAAFNGDEFQFLEGMDTKYRIEKTLYIFNSGSWNNWHEQDSLGTGTNTDGTNTPGQYYAIPVLAARENYLEGLQTTIAPMQGIYLRVRSLTPLNELPESGEQVGNLVLNYEQLVMGSGHEMHRPMRAPQRTTSSAMQDPNFRRVRIVATSENSGADRVYIIQDNINTRKYNNGYDATNQEAKGLVNIYTNETGGKMEVSCSNNIDSMYIGFMAGSDHTYTLHFSAIIGDILYLQDLDNGQKISIVEGGSYTFEAEPQSTNHKRFLLLTSQGVSTGTDEVALANIWYSNKALHITNAPNNSTLTLYDISGHQLLSTTIQETPYTLDLSHLTEGIYIARLNNQVYKFVCK